MASTFDVCIRGGGIVGRTLALLLAKERLKVALVVQDGPDGSAPDPYPAPAPDCAPADIRAYALNQKSKTLLESVRAWPEAAHATPVLAMQVLGDDGGEVVFNAADTHSEALAWIVDVPTLQAQLAQATQFQPQIQPFTTPQTATLTVVCEGKTSQSREEFGVEFDVAPYTQRAIAARLVCELPHQQAARQWFANESILGVLPLGQGDAAGGDGAQAPLGNSVAIVWSVEDARALALMALDEAGFAKAVQDACHDRYGRMALATGRAVWPLQLARTQAWVGKNAAGVWALAGDAAHTVHPLSGQGLNLGLADVAELATLLAGRDYWRTVDDEKLLRRYERSRKVDAALLSGTTDGLQRLFARPGNTWASLRNLGMNGFERSGPLKNWVTRQAMGR